MEKENIMTVDIEDFKKSQHILDYIDDDFAIVRGGDVPPQFAGGAPYLFFEANVGVIFFSHCSCGCTGGKFREDDERRQGSRERDEDGPDRETTGLFPFLRILSLKERLWLSTPR